MIDLALLLQIAAACPAHAPSWRVAAHAQVESGLQPFVVRDNTLKRSLVFRTQRAAAEAAQ